MNTLYYGDNLKILQDRSHFPDSCVDLVYLDPPFNSNRDKGIDGTIVFIEPTTNKSERVIVQEKSGKVRSGDIRDLAGTAEREKAAIAVFITLEKPSRDMTTEAVGKGFYHSEGWNKDYLKLQIPTIEELLSGKQVNIPPSATTFKQAERIGSETKNQQTFGFE